MPRRVAEISVETVHDRTHARVIAAGEMDVAWVVALNRAMSEAAACNVAVDLDLSGVTFVDSRFSAAVGGWERELGARRLTLKLPADTGLHSVLAHRSRKSPRFRSRPAGR